MAIANLHETLLMYTARKNALNEQITEYQSQKSLALLQQADVNSVLAKGKQDIRNTFKALYESDPDLQAKYKDYTEIPDFDDEIEKLTAKYNDDLEEVSAWETQLDAQITTASAELQEVQAYQESIKSMLQSNISEDFNYSLNQ